MPAGQLDERRQVRCHLGDAARRDHRQQAVLRAADDQRRHRQVLQPDVLGPERVDQRAGPAAAACGRCRGEQLVDEFGDAGIGVAADRDRRRRTVGSADPTARSSGAAPNVLSRVPAARTRRVGQRAAARAATARRAAGRRWWC